MTTDQASDISLASATDQLTTTATDHQHTAHVADKPSDVLSSSAAAAASQRHEAAAAAAKRQPTAVKDARSSDQQARTPAAGTATQQTPPADKPTKVSVL